MNDIIPSKCNTEKLHCETFSPYSTVPRQKSLPNDFRQTEFCFYRKDFAAFSWNCARVKKVFSRQRSFFTTRVSRVAIFQTSHFCLSSDTCSFTYSRDVMFKCHKRKFCSRFGGKKKSRKNHFLNFPHFYSSANDMLMYCLWCRRAFMT